MVGCCGLCLFFFEEIKRIDEWHKSNLKPSTYTENQIEAGFVWLSERWGFALAVKELSQYNVTSEKELLKLSTYEFYTHVQIKNNVSYVTKEYEKIVKETKKE